VQRCLDLVPGPCRWKAAEYFAATQLEAVMIALAAAAFGMLLFGPISALGLGAAIFGIMSEMRLRGAAELAARRRAEVRSRLPYILDLMALMMEAGALFPACLETAVAENSGHPSSEEFGHVQAGMRQGVARSVALRELAERLDDADVGEVVFAINTAEDLGTPLDKILRSLAERMRGRRIQELERAAEEAKVHITWPAMLVMLACLLIVAAPSVLSGLFNG
jgi:tight adherence protein C